MAKIATQSIMVSVSKLVKDDEKDLKLVIFNLDLMESIQQVIQELIQKDHLVVEVSLN